MPEDTSTTGSRAVFLSYSREDTEPARRIADALRAFGLEVWFDQNELRGGDSWDAKIRKQIRECSLFLPIISTHTQSRVEGYFRREWKLGVERTHDMAGGVAFITPVVIDETLESAALVPDEFMRYQWTRLPHGVPTPEFVGQVKRLLEAPKQAAAAVPIRAPAAHAAAPAATAVPSKAPLPGWVWGAAGAAVVGIGAALFITLKPARPATAAQPAAEAAQVPATPVASDKSIAVLPFDNMSEEKDASAFFADGMQEDILTNLSFIHDLRVVSRTSVMQYRGTTKPIRQIAKELGVTYVLEGSVRRAGNKVRVTGQLIRAATDEHVWAKAFDRDITDVFAIQAELSQAIAGALQAAISPAEQTLIDRKPTSNPAAYDLFLKARAGYEGNSLDLGLQEKWLVDAVQLDPAFAQAWALLGAIHAGARFNEIDGSAERLAKAKAAIETAIRLAPDDPVVIEMQGDYYYYGYRDYTSAAAQYRRLQGIRPNSPEAFGSLGLIYRRQGRWPDAVENLRRSIELDPQNLRYRTTLSAQLLAMRRYDETLAEMQRAVELSHGAVFVWKYFSAVIPFISRGSTAEGDALFAGVEAAKKEDPEEIDFHRNWARLTGDFALAVRLDERQPYFDGGGNPHWAQDFMMASDRIGSGDMLGGRARLERLLPDLKAQLLKEPSNSSLWLVMGFTEAVLGDREGALAAAARATELVPEANDAVDGPQRAVSRAQILAWVGEKDKAMAELARLLQVPYGANVHSELHDPGWMPLRDDPRFKALLDDPKNNEPIL
jgi:TolB-like protein/cytochrome c-type biogenesis protein CcmH/NrfG